MKLTEVLGIQTYPANDTENLISNYQIFLHIQEDE